MNGQANSKAESVCRQLHNIGKCYGGIQKRYSPKYADTNASKLLENTRISDYIKQRTEPESEKRIATGDDVMRFFTRVMNGEEKDAFGLDASLDIRTKAAVELAKRTCDIKDSKTDGGITIINNIPKPSAAD